MQFTITEHYFEFTPMAGHRQTCSRYGTALWEIAERTRFRLRPEERGGDYTETTLRTMCTECGVVRLDGGEDGSETTTVEQIGYGSQPQRCAGFWLHPGPLFGYRGLDEHGPTRFLVTGNPEAPTSRDDVIGSVAWFKTRRGALRWSAGYGITEYGNPSRVPDPNEYKSRTAAVRWVADQHAAALAADQAPVQQ